MVSLPESLVLRGAIGAAGGISMAMKPVEAATEKVSVAAGISL